MTRLETIQAEFDSIKLFDGKLNKVAVNMAKMLGEDIPFNMALGIANYTMSSFVSHFQCKINFSEGNLVPPNIVVFILAKSGAKKTSSVLKLESALAKGIDEINLYRMKIEKEKADEAGVQPKKLNPLTNALATEAGMIKRLNDFKREGIGLPTMFVDEISTELASNPDIVPNIKLVSQLFDSGEMKSKPLKDSENQSDEVNGMGMAALFIGSEHGILEDDIILGKFETAFISQLARRCNFIYPEFVKVNKDAGDISSILKQVHERREASSGLKEEINELSGVIAKTLLEQDIRIIEVAEDAMNLYILYSLYCEDKAEMIEEESINLEQCHRHWKAFKLAGTYAVFNLRNRIEVEDLRQAINCMERTSGDLGKFIYKAKRETYEVLLDYYMEGGSELTVHEMIKKGWIKKQADVKNLIINANSKLGSIGMLEEDEDKIVYTKYTSREGIGASFMLVSGTKEQRVFKCAEGFEYKITTFEKLGNLLCNDTAFIPFEFVGGKRGKDNIVGGADFIILDIDDSDVTAEEAHNLLMDYKHIIARTSDASNPYKFRVILVLDVQVEIHPTKWKLFMAKVGEYLGLKIDNLAQSQIYFGYKGRELLINEDGEELNASTLMKDLGEPVQVVKPQPRRVRDKIWINRAREFHYAYKGRASGIGLHTGLFSAMRHAFDLGFSYQENIDLLEDIMETVRDTTGEEPRPSFLPSLISQRNTVYGMS